MSKEPFLSILSLARNEGYGCWPLPCRRDEEITALVRALAREGHTERLQDDYAPVLIAFAERMETLARREQSTDRLRVGLVAACFASSLGDRREAVAVLPLLWRSAEKLGLRGETEFLSVGKDLRCGAALGDFARREPRDRSIEAMGCVEVEDESGFRYERTW